MTKPSTFIWVFFVGAFLMFAFDFTITLVLGMALQVTAVVLGVFAIATPEFLRSDMGEGSAEE